MHRLSHSGCEWQIAAGELAGLDTPEEIAEMISRPVVHVPWHFWKISATAMYESAIVPEDSPFLVLPVQRSFGSLEDDSHSTVRGQRVVWGFGGPCDIDARKSVPDINPSWRVSIALRVDLSACLYSKRRAKLQGRANDSEQVTPEVSKNPEGEITEHPERPKYVIRIIRHPCRRPEPHIVVEVEFGWDDTVVVRHNQISDFVLPNINVRDVSDDASLNQLDDAMGVIPCADLVPKLKNTTVALLGFEHSLSLSEAVAQRLLAIDMLSRLDSENSEKRMPVIWRGDCHSINVLPVEKLAEIAISLHPGIPSPASSDNLACPLPVFSVYIADTQNSEFWPLHVLENVAVIANISGADGTDVDLVRGGNIPQ